jgi:hypothetical protein
MAEAFPPEKLLDLYKIALDEYRFEVRLGWDRTTYFLVLNSAILSVATGLLKLNSPPVVYAFIALLFAFGIATSLIGSLSITKAHEYYRRTVVRKTLIEQCLGLNSSPLGMHQSLNLATSTTRGQSERMKILSDPEGWVARPHGRRAITFWLRWILWGMAVVDGFGFCAASIILYQKWIFVSQVALHHWRFLLL